jgi:hypothetical protein
MVSQAQAKVWTVLFSFYAVHDKSPELRAIRYAIEKSNKNDAIELYLNMKDSVVKALSVDLQRTTLDEVYIAPNDLAQVFIVVFGEAAVSKTYLLRTIQSRSDNRGTCAGDLVAVLLIDFLKTRENNIKAKNKPRDMDNLSFLNNKARADIINRFNLKFDNLTEQTDEPSVHLDTRQVTPSGSARKQTRGVSSTHKQGNYGSKDDASSTQRTKDSEKKNSETGKRHPSPGGKVRVVSKSTTMKQRRYEGSDKKKQVKQQDLPVDKILDSKELKIVEFTREDLARQLDYIVQSKSKSEQSLVNCLSLLKKNNGDFNELLKYATDIKTSMQLLFNKLTRAREEKVSDLSKKKGIGRRRESQEVGAFPEPPISEKLVNKYAVQLESHVSKTTKTEIHPLMQKFTERTSPVVTVSQTAPKDTRKRDMEARTSE